MESSSNTSISSTSDYKILIVEDEYIIANDLEIILHGAGYPVIGIAKSVSKARDLIERERPDMVLLDIYLKGGETGIELAKQLEKSNIPFIYTSANDNQSLLDAVKYTKPSGYIVKPFRKKDILSALQTGRSLHAQSSTMTADAFKALEKELVENLEDTENWNDRLLTTARLIQKYIPFDLYTIRHYTHTNSEIFSYHRVGFDDYQILSVNAIQKRTSPNAESEPFNLKTIEPEVLSVYTQKELASLCRKDTYIELLVKTFRLESALLMPLNSNVSGRISICFLSRNPDMYTAQHQFLLENIRQSLLLTAERILKGQAL